MLTFAAIPYLTRVLGVSGWGKLVFIQISLSYLCWFTNWGFYLGGTKSIAAFRDNINKKNNIFSAIWTSQLLITLVVSFIFIVLISNIDFFYKDYFLYLSGLLVIIGNLLMPLWYLNGIEKIVESSFAQILVKFFSLPLYIYFINGPNDISRYFIINGSVAILVGLAMLLWMHIRLRVVYLLPSFYEVIKITKENSSLFLSTILANVNTSIVPYSLGFYSGDEALGLFNIADRMRGAAVQILHPISHALFPRMGYLMANDRYSAKILLKKSGIILTVLSLILSIILFIFSDNIVYLVAGIEFQNAGILLKILAVSPLITTLSSFLIYQIIIPEGFDSSYLIGISTMGLISLLFAIPILIFYGTYGSAMLVVAVEVIGLMLFTIFCLKKVRL